MFYGKFFTIKSLLEHGVHYGHKKNRWNPKMAQYIYGIKNKVHIIDLEQTASMLDLALFAIQSVTAKNGKILFVSTKKNSNDIIAEQAQRCGQYYINKRWLGGMLSNWSTVSSSVKRMEEYENLLQKDDAVFKKKEKLIIKRKFDKLYSVLGGIRTMNGLPDMLFVIDARKHRSAIAEANRLGIEVVSVVDTNTDPTNIDFVIPGNDDARKSIEIFATLAAEAALVGVNEARANNINENTDATVLKHIPTKKLTIVKKHVSKLRSNKKVSTNNVATNNANATNNTTSSTVADVSTNDSSQTSSNN